MCLYVTYSCVYCVTITLSCAVTRGPVCVCLHWDSGDFIFCFFLIYSFPFYPLCVTNDLSVAICTTFIVILRKLRPATRTHTHSTHSSNEPFSEEEWNEHTRLQHRSPSNPLYSILSSSSPGKHHKTSFYICVSVCVWRWSSTSESKITEIAIVAYLTHVNDNALWIWQIDSLPFQIINRLCAVVWPVVVAIVVSSWINYAANDDLHKCLCTFTHITSDTRT